MNWVLISVAVTPRASPKSIAVTSVANDFELETITTPKASIPTKSKPIAVSSLMTVLLDTNVMSPLITSAAQNAPTKGLKPQRTATAIPGMTP